MANSVDIIRRENAIRECEMEIAWNKRTLASKSATEEDKADARKRIAHAEKVKKEIESAM